MTTFDSAFVSRVTAEAKDIKFGVTVLTWLGALLYGIGWLIGKVFAVAWLVITWTFAALKVGFQDARTRKPERRRRGGS